MKIITSDVPILNVDPGSVETEQIYNSLEEAEGSLNSEPGTYQAHTANFYNVRDSDSAEDILENLSKGQMRCLVVPQNYPQQPNSEPLYTDFKTDVTDLFQQKFEEINQKVGEEYGIDYWSFTGLEAYSTGDLDQIRRDFVESSSEMPLKLTTTVDIGLNDDITLGWFESGEEIGFGYWIKPGRSQKEFGPDTDQEDIEEYLSSLEFIDGAERRTFEDEEINRILEFNRFLIEEDII
jgi:hypothetical protein